MATLVSANGRTVSVLNASGISGTLTVDFLARGASNGASNRCAINCLRNMYEEYVLAVA